MPANIHSSSKMWPKRVMCHMLLLHSFRLPFDPLFPVSHFPPFHFTQHTHTHTINGSIINSERFKTSSHPLITGQLHCSEVYTHTHPHAHTVCKGTISLNKERNKSRWQMDGQHLFPSVSWQPGANCKCQKIQNRGKGLQQTSPLLCFSPLPFPFFPS